MVICLKEKRKLTIRRRHLRWIGTLRARHYIDEADLSKITDAVHEAVRIVHVKQFPSLIWISSSEE
jgi:hypothetical protein